ncbi:tRNA glutamyl-Q(34) synthetase GluQRS [Pseudoxanthomonas yeongjuensis]|nr:tRNA glutamyl-Q(34) synthetase GluQRS [Pseudoxanthomonas yeongjuensis]KAF1717591.1 tRNA glutamyl-Q(34) synthetase GluQRS [Pseudoxanthomonas yeongjuensis]
MPAMTIYRGRFAPSPTGPLHFGSLLAAFGSWLLARHAGGEWWVRMEDLDPPREVAGAARTQLATLEAFGLHSDAIVEWQSRRSAFYQAALQRLLEQGEAFECHCSRSELAANGGIHRACVGNTRRADPAVRLRVAEGTVVTFEDQLQGRFSQDVAGEVGDFVLRRADGLWAYQLAVVVDDAAQGMTDIVRGADLLDSTPRQILLQQALGLPTPRYLHLPLIVDGNGRKLSKSDAALPIDADAPLPALDAAWRALGQDPASLRGSTDAASLLAASVASFMPSRLPRAASLSTAALHNTTDTNAV